MVKTDERVQRAEGLGSIYWRQDSVLFCFFSVTNMKGVANISQFSLAEERGLKDWHAMHMLLVRHNLLIMATKSRRKIFCKRALLSFSCLDNSRLIVFWLTLNFLIFWYRIFYQSVVLFWNSRHASTSSSRWSNNTILLGCRSSLRVMNISLFDFVFIRKNPELTFGISFSAMNLNWFIALRAVEISNAPIFRRIKRQVRWDHYLFPRP